MQPSILKTNRADEYFFEEGCYILEYSNSEADPELSLARARVLPNTSTQLHKLNQTIERYLILEGIGEVTLEPRNKGEAIHSIVEAGDVVIIPEGCPQSIHNTGKKELVFLVICSPRFKAENYSEC